jgi:hypothetical protein
VYPFGGKEPDGFIIQANPSAGDCEISILPPAFGEGQFNDDEDVIIAFDAMGPVLQRTTFAFTITPGSRDTAGCSGPPAINQMGPGAAVCH